MKNRVAFLVLMGLIGGCGGKAKPPAQAAPDATGVRAAPDSAVREPPRKRPVALGGGCSCVALTAGPADAKARRKVLVQRLDRLNGSLRAHMAKIDAALPDETKGHIEAPAGLHKARQGLACQLDCVLHQFPHATAALWSYLDIVGRFLDTSRRTVARLAVPPNKRARGPSLTQLTRLFNRTARTSNVSIGLALLSHPVPRSVVGVDRLSFRAKTRRWRDQHRKDIANFRHRWMPFVKKLRPTGPALVQTVRLRVALARMRQTLRHHGSGARAVVCERGKDCAPPQARWRTVQRLLRDLAKQLQRVAQTLRNDRAGVPLARGRRMTATTEKTLGTLRTATLAL